MATEWQRDWSCFVDEVELRLRNGDDAPELSQLFGGKLVNWEGVLDEKSIDDLAPLVSVSLKEKQIDLGNGKSAILDGVSLPIARDSIAEWETLKIGAVVKFTAVLGSAKSPFPSIEVVHLKSGRSVVMVRLSDGRLVR